MSASSMQSKQSPTNEPNLVVVETFKKHGFDFLIYQCQRCGRKYTAVKALKISVCHCLIEGKVK